MAETILYEKTGNIVTITLNRPDSLNAINRLLRQELADAARQQMETLPYVEAYDSC